MIPRGPTEIVNRLVYAVPVQIWAIGIVTECPIDSSDTYREALNLDVWSSPRDPGEFGNTGKIQLRHDVTNVGEFARLQIVEVIEAEPEFIDLRRR